jgi:hypothetical protein
MLVAVKVVRPTMIGGEAREVGDLVELPQAQALDAASGGRVVLVKADAAAAEEPAAKPAKKASKAE